ncbi:MAG: TM2 domain-containing protein [Ruminobacter sp.]|uniref:TM2 domain-containing membrane protein YozV n=1 Tax=Ruminobacter amylophilus TaxID=867 RepID=A0A662ZGC4_9GAMM|nr:MULTISPECIES: TM2 domain-containing protein [Ruminobacter]MBQ3775068.1 TM2 domain-containing protein [Ruminobacter sp.]SFP26786.1 TM2 domain-containing membrane protein YozV [Ruminobacter amylophilus]
MTDSANVKTVTVDKLIYILLAFFLGALGVHKFYAGQTGMGIIYLVMCLASFLVIPGLVLLVCVWWEIIVAAMANADENGRITLKAGFVNTKA